MSEIWLPIIDFEKFYEVSDLGRVKSLDRMTNNRWGTFSLRPGRILAERSIKGYSWVALYNEEGRTDRPIHHLVLEAFVELRPVGMEANHVNDVSWDNRLVNLKWDTHFMNMHNPDWASGEERLDMIRAGL